MRFRRLGRTGLTVSELTLGTSRLEAPEASAAASLALQGGINAVELAAANLEAASLIGDVVKREGARQHVHVFSRLTSLVSLDLPSPHVLAHQAYPGRHIRAETESLLRTLGVDRLALQQLHVWTPEWLHEGDWLETLGRLREEGKIAGIGISLFDHDLQPAAEAVASGRIDAVQLMYNLFDQGAAAGLLRLCRKHDVGVIARSPLHYGVLSSRIEQPFASGDWRRDYFFDEHLAETRERVARLAGEVEPPDRSVTDMALRFCLSHPAVSTVAVGMASPRQVEANLQALSHGPLSSEKLARLGQHKWLC